MPIEFRLNFGMSKVFDMLKDKEMPSLNNVSEIVISGDELIQTKQQFPLLKINNRLRTMRLSGDLMKLVILNLELPAVGN